MVTVIGVYHVLMSALVPLVLCNEVGINVGNCSTGLEQEKAVRQVLSNDHKTAHIIATWQDIEVLESINKAFAPQADLTDIISGEDYVTISTVKPLLHQISTKALAEESDDTKLTSDIKERIRSEKYSDSEVNMLLDLATVLDPRFKVDYIIVPVTWHL